MVNRSDKYNFTLADPVNYRLLKEEALRQRQHPTDAERVFWELLKSEMPDIRFRNQYIIGNFIVDFVALKQRLIIEIDGGYHFNGEQESCDAEREEYLRNAGFRVVRFTNHDVLSNGETVIRAIRAEI